MCIGIDIAAVCERKMADRLILLSGDTDIVPAMKHARKSGLQVVITILPKAKLAPELLAHADIRREVQWPPGFQPSS